MREAYVVQLTDRDRLRVEFTLDRGRPADVVVQLEGSFEPGDRWMAVRRFDEAHGALHVHLAPWDEARDRRVAIRAGGPKDALTTAIEDLKANWPKYRAACEAALSRREK